MSCKLLVLLCILSTCLRVHHCAKILGVFNIASVSHQVVFQPIWKELSLRGHEVTIMSPNPLRDPSLVNLTEIDLSFLYKDFDDLKKDLAQSLDHWAIMDMMSNFLEVTIEELFKYKDVQELVNDNNTKFDVVLVEAITPALFAFAAKYQCPLIGVASLSTTNDGHELVGNPNHPILYPEVITAYPEDMTFLQKVDSVLFDIYSRYLYSYKMYPTMNRISKKYFGEDTPDLQDIGKNMSMLFLNTNPILHRPRSYGPNVIQMGRMHLKPKKPLPNDLKEFLDNSTQGVIYFSLGSNVKSKFLDKSKRELINEVFSELPYNILWKFEDEHLEGKPDNVKISKWLPQQDLLGHPNIKLFITQGGLQSLEEAISNGVPLLAIPFIADQYANADRIEKLGIGLQLRYLTLIKEDFKTSILRIVENPGYKQKVLEISRLMQDEPSTGLERAVWWTEYVIRNKGAPYFKNRSVDMSWYEFLLLDVIVFLFGILSVALFVTYKLTRLLYRIVCYRFIGRKEKTL